MPIPDLTHLQFLVLIILGAKERPGREVRERLAEEGETRTLAAFYQMMMRLEDAGLVRGRDVPKMVHGHEIRERWYKITGSGLMAMDATQEFYRRRDLGAMGGKEAGNA